MKSATMLALAVCLLTAGCVTSNVMTEVDREYESRFGYFERVGTWFVDRINDAGDVVQVTGTYGFGLLANIHFTELGQLGIGWFEGGSISWEERAFGVYRNHRSEYGVGPYYYIDVERKCVAGGIWPLIPFFPSFRMYPTYAFRHDYSYSGLDILEKPVWKEDDGHYANVGFRFHLFCVGAEIDWSLSETLDWLLGWNPVGLILTLCNYYETPWDFMQDDTWHQVRIELEAERNLETK